jgi:hypothetical protein
MSQMLELHSTFHNSSRFRIFYHGLAAFRLVPASLLHVAADGVPHIAGMKRVVKIFMVLIACPLAPWSVRATRPCPTSGE